MGIRHLLAILVLTVTVFMPIGPADADINTAADEAQFVAMINQLRTSRGLNPLIVDPDLRAQARQWSQVMAADDKLKHASDLAVGMTTSWDVLGENVGVHSIPNLDELFQAFVKSPAHLTNLLDPRFDYVGVGVVYDSQGSIWTTHRFMSVREQVAPAPATTTSTAPPTTQAPTTQAPTTTVTTRRPAAPAPPPTTAAPATSIAPTRPAIASTSTSTPARSTAPPSTARTTSTGSSTARPSSTPATANPSTPAGPTAGAVSSRPVSNLLEPAALTAGLIGRPRTPPPLSTTTAASRAQLDRALISAMIVDLDRAGI